MDGDPPFFQDHGKVLGDLQVHGGQDAVHGLHNGHLASKDLVHRGELHPDDPAADDDQVLVQLILQKEELIAGAHMGQVQAGDGGPGGFGAGGHQDIFAGQFHRALPSGHSDAVGAGQGAGALVQVDLIGFDQLFNAGAKLFNHLVFAVVDFLDVKGYPLGTKAHRFKFLDTPIQGGSVEQGFGGDAPPVEAGAAHLAVLH